MARSRLIMMRPRRRNRTLTSYTQAPPPVVGLLLLHCHTTLLLSSQGTPTGLVAQVAPDPCEPGRWTTHVLGQK